MKLVPEPSISIPSWEGRGMLDTEVSSLKVVGEDMVWAKTAMQETELEESNTECMAAWSRAPSAATSHALYRPRAIGACGSQYEMWGKEGLRRVKSICRMTSDCV